MIRDETLWHITALAIEAHESWQDVNRVSTAVETGEFHPDTLTILESLAADADTRLRDAIDDLTEPQRERIKRHAKP